jgi:hypothetical protein
MQPLTTADPTELAVIRVDVDLEEPGCEVQFNSLWVAKWLRLQVLTRDFTGGMV